MLMSKERKKINFKDILDILNKETNFESKTVRNVKISSYKSNYEDFQVNGMQIYFQNYKFVGVFQIINLLLNYMYAFKNLLPTGRMTRGIPVSLPVKVKVIPNVCISLSFNKRLRTLSTQILHTYIIQYYLYYIHYIYYTYILLYFIDALYTIATVTYGTVQFILMFLLMIYFLIIKTQGDSLKNNVQSTELISKFSVPMFL